MGISYFVASVIANSVVYLSSCSISSERSTGNTNTARDHLPTDIFPGTLKRNLPKGKIRWPPPAHLFPVAPKVTQPLLKALENAQRPNSIDEVRGFLCARCKYIFCSKCTSQAAKTQHPRLMREQKTYVCGLCQDLQVSEQDHRNMRGAASSD